MPVSVTLFPRTGRHQPLISEETFALIEKRLKKPYATTRIRLDIRPDFPLRGLVNCRCGTPLTSGYSTGRTKKYAYYSCRQKGCELKGKSIDRDLIEQDFKKLIQAAKVKPQTAKVVEAVFDVVWKQELGQTQKREEHLIAQSRALEEKIQSLTELVCRAQNELLKRAYEQQIEEAAATLENLKRSIGDHDFDVPYRTALKKAVGLAKNPYSVWRKMSVHDQHGLFYFIFDEKITYTEEEGFRTTEIPTAARLFDDLAAVDCSNVDRVMPTFEQGESRFQNW